MKLITLLTYMAIAFTNLAGKPYTIEIKAVDSDLRMPLSGVRINFLSEKNLILFYTYTDKEGKASFDNCQEKVVLIEATPAEPNYSKTTYYYNKKIEEGSIVVLELTNLDVFYDKIEVLTAATPIDSTHMVNSEECGEDLVDAQFPGGDEAMYKFLQHNLRYPERALEEGIGGKCYLRFYVDYDGTISNISLPKRLEECPDCEYEAILVIKKMPKWTPGVCNGKNIGMFYNLPIRFTPG